MESMSFEGRRDGADCTRGGTLLSNVASMPRSPTAGGTTAGTELATRRGTLIRGAMTTLGLITRARALWRRPHSSSLEGEQFVTTDTIVQWFTPTKLPNAIQLSPLPALLPQLFNGSHTTPADTSVPYQSA